MLQYQLCLLFMICVLSSVALGAKDPYSYKVTYSEDKRNCTDEVKNDTNCITDPEATIDDCHTSKLVRDHIDCCRVCPKKVGDTCGGYFSNHGRCDGGSLCRHETIPHLTYQYDAESKQNLQPGICIPMSSKAACKKKDCCSKGKELICGTDGKWYLNKCFRVKANCFRPVGKPIITKYSGDSIAHCGEKPPDCITPAHICTIQSRLGDPRPTLYYTPELYQCNGDKGETTPTPTPSLSPSSLPSPSPSPSSTSVSSPGRKD